MNSFFHRLLKGEPLSTICRDDGNPSYNTIIKMLASKEEEHQEFKSEFFRIQAMRPLLIMDSINDISTKFFDAVKEDKEETPKGRESPITVPSNSTPITLNF